MMPELNPAPSPGSSPDRTDNTLEDHLKERILVLDGAMGTMIQNLGLTEDDHRNAELADH